MTASLLQAQAARSAASAARSIHSRMGASPPRSENVVAPLPPHHRQVIVPGTINLEDWLDDPDGGKASAPLLCVFTGSRQEEGTQLLEALEALGLSGTVRIQKRPCPMVTPGISQSSFLAFKVFTFDNHLRAAVWGGKKPSQPWRDIGGMRVYTHLDAAPPGEGQHRQLWAKSLASQGYWKRMSSPPRLTSRARLGCSPAQINEEPLAKARKSAAAELATCNIPGWSCIKGLHSYMNDDGIFVVAVVPEGGVNFPPASQGWAKIEDGDGMATRVVFDRWGLFWGPERARPAGLQTTGPQVPPRFYAAPESSGQEVPGPLAAPRAVPQPRVPETVPRTGSGATLEHTAGAARGVAQADQLKALMVQQAATFEARLKAVEERTIQALSMQQVTQREEASGWDSRFAALEKAAASTTARQDATYTLMAGMHQMLLDSAARSEAADTRRKRIWGGQGGHNARRKLLPTPPAAPSSASAAAAQQLSQSPVDNTQESEQG